MTRTHTMAALISLLALFTACGSTQPGSVEGSNATTTAPTDSRAAISAWYTSGGRQRVTAITTDLSAASAAASASNIHALATACTSLQAHVEDAQSYQPVPAAAVQADWSTGLSQYARAATDCLAGTSSSDPGLINRSAQEMAAGSAAIQGATAAVTAAR